MIDLKKETISKYVRHLNTLGCKFKIIESDGTEHGDLATVPERTRSPRVEVLRLVDYKTPMMAMKPGDVISLTATPDMPLESLRSSIAGFATYEFGVGAVTTTLDRNNNAVLVLRVE